MSTTEAVEPRKLTVGDKLHLGVALAVTLVRVFSLLGAAFSLLFFGFTFNTGYLSGTGWGLFLYVVSTIVMHELGKKSNRDADARADSSAQAL